MQLVVAPLHECTGFHCFPDVLLPARSCRPCLPVLSDPVLSDPVLSDQDRRLNPEIATDTTD